MAPENFWHVINISMTFQNYCQPLCLFGATKKKNLKETKSLALRAYNKYTVWRGTKKRTSRGKIWTSVFLTSDSWFSGQGVRKTCWAQVISETPPALALSSPLPPDWAPDPPPRRHLCERHRLFLCALPLVSEHLPTPHGSDSSFIPVRHSASQGS